ncbi:crotonase/enoyl-CoA hydratase family protein [Bradyrhizobium sp. CCBAU 53421]|uniref:crotonase/enoyl-CoA hydratase family protein n=1 Tax=Bradyrhizobium sp. CCBAU 53421 TaxID=1325120 RepID=UPI00188BC54B|nr:crotonase/enoyl-CoA hydratase family protein [Bradyrhizobium sp. CCBAU 53421]QOZ32806.1 crotonase/enoyl-CoA hydratase family protein [Bradyrhizobium sp. CCBAU 53421]
MTVRIERRDRVLTVIQSRPDVRNAVDPDHADALYDAFVAFEADEAVDVAVFWGEGGAFCAGADLKSLAARGIATPENRSTHRSLEFPKDGSFVPRGPMGPSRLELGKPVIAAIEGPAVAGGMELALWADCRIMAQDAYMGVYNRRWGVPLTDGGAVRLPRLVGEGRALELIMTGRKVSADECLRIGLCERVVPKGQARQAAEEMARVIAGFPQLSLRADRRSVHLQHGLTERAALEKEWYNCTGVFKAESATGIARFAGGAGRHGDFGRATTRS